MKSFVLMLTFFTRIPIKYEYDCSEKTYVNGLKYVPLIGFMVGAILYGIALAGRGFDRPVLSMLILLAYLWITGGLHLDGLADTCDGIFSGRQKTKMLEIMKDSRIGAFGVMSLFIVFSAYLILFSFVELETLILFPVIGKSGIIISGFISEYAREDGMGKVFNDNCKLKELSIAVIFPFVICIILKAWISMASAFASMMFVLVMAGYIKARIGGMTGDTLGFVCETSQIIFLFMTYAMNSFI